MLVFHARLTSSGMRLKTREGVRRLFCFSHRRHLRVHRVRFTNLKTLAFTFSRRTDDR